MGEEDAYGWRFRTAIDYEIGGVELSLYFDELHDIVLDQVVSKRICLLRNLRGRLNTLLSTCTTTGRLPLTAFP